MAITYGRTKFGNGKSVCLFACFVGYLVIIIDQLFLEMNVIIHLNMVQLVCMLLLS